MSRLGNSVAVAGLLLVLATAGSMACKQPDSRQTTPGQSADGRSGGAPADRPAHWATPIPDQPGVSNLFKVNDGLYRSAQPEDEGFDTLRELGVRTVVNLRTFHSDRKECERAGLGYVHITVQAWEGEDEEVAEFLRVATDPVRQPVLVHCQHGADRTGTMVAVYRIAVEGWSKEEAIREMTEGGYGFHSVWKNLITYIEQLDVQRIREQAGLAAPTPAQDSETSAAHG